MDLSTALMLFGDAVMEMFVMCLLATTHLMIVAATVFSNALSVLGTYCSCLSIGCCAIGVIVAVSLFPQVLGIIRRHGCWAPFSCGRRGSSRRRLGDWGPSATHELDHSGEEELRPSPFSYACPPEVPPFEWGYTSALDDERWSSPDARLLHEGPRLSQEQLPHQEPRNSFAAGVNEPSQNEDSRNSKQSMDSGSRVTASNDSVARRNMFIRVDEARRSVAPLSHRRPISHCTHPAARLYHGYLEKGSITDGIVTPPPPNMFIENAVPQESSDIDSDSEVGSDDLDVDDSCRRLM